MASLTQWISDSLVLPDMGKNAFEDSTDRDALHDCFHVTLSRPHQHDWRVGSGGNKKAAGQIFLGKSHGQADVELRIESPARLGARGII